jgi:uncharacterized protein (UPF0276 family)
VNAAGIGLRHPHHAALLAQPPRLPFVEVHSENFFADGGAALAVLDAARERWPVSLHGVGLSLGAAAGLDEWHLDRLARLAERCEPVRISDHAAFARVPRRHGDRPGALHGNDLLPLAFTDAALDVLVANVQTAQERLRRPIGVENLSAYLGWVDDAIAEPEFFNALSRRSGCWLLLDVNNLVVNALNTNGGDEVAAVAAAKRWVDTIDVASVGEIHLAGYARADGIVIDDHGSRVHAPVWAVFEHAVARLGPRPTLVEWDTELPAPEVLLEEAARADAVLAAA